MLKASLAVHASLAIISLALCGALMPGAITPMCLPQARSSRTAALMSLDEVKKLVKLADHHSSQGFPRMDGRSGPPVNTGGLAFCANYSDCSCCDHAASAAVYNSIKAMLLDPEFSERCKRYVTMVACRSAAYTRSSSAGLLAQQHLVSCICKIYISLRQTSPCLCVHR